MMIVVSFINPSLQYVFLRNVVMSAVCLVIAGQQHWLVKFLCSHYCRQVSRKTASAVIRRSYFMVTVCLFGFVAAGFLVQPAEPWLHDPIPTDQVIASDGERGSGVEDLPDVELVIDREVVAERGANERFEVREDLLMIIAYVVVTLLFGYLIFTVVKNLHRRAPVVHFDDFDEVETQEAADIVPRFKKRRRLLSFGVNYTVRRLFRLKVQEYMAGNLLLPGKGDTPAKLAEEICQWEDVGTLKRLYHKARYSGENVQRTELSKYYQENR